MDMKNRAILDSLDAGEMDSIHGNYRMALRAMNRTQRAAGGSTCRMADRKQRALAEVAERRGLPVSVVKDVVRRMDLERGITHEVPEAQLVIWRWDAAFQEATEVLGNRFSEGDPCTLCGRTDAMAQVRLRTGERNFRATNAHPTVDDFIWKCLMCP